MAGEDFMDPSVMDMTAHNHKGINVVSKVYFEEEATISIFAPENRKKSVKALLDATQGWSFRSVNRDKDHCFTCDKN